ncbi:prepilin-type N-terminal cleavage/methylation domain-containing protein [Desulfosporosinus orientis DSM 765]|uniref:Prepilin-type N-terminal cleavage/methylation domain-containing protein n=1 Tax=Desulfosporosinus orientis (strain ATCC 19365 / DSM 765 / NCIMB 8382 / VKM B-1628 / Singapore I) TaxID=768706 RepID=G7W5M1_DESOD|nr:prepilin-type N-terminal cleavage/methylation domain-containing protein [Desulfosporosinus orientis]AET66668.1 prepilin-type N-terminal cleavage/methylation domain-containing protein [Desulfosporosinus orientis DSM 765]
MMINWIANSNDDYPKNNGFTLVEVMIAVSIFGLLLLYVFQIMHMQFGFFQSASKENDLNHNTRAAMMHILDEIRLNPNAEKDRFSTGNVPPVKKYYYPGDAGFDEGVYYVYRDPDDINTEIECCLININPQNTASLPEGPFIYLVGSELWYRDVNNNNKLISDQIKSIKLSTEPGLEHIDRLLKIEITALDNSQLISWIRLY